MTDKKGFKTAYEILDKVSEYEYVNTDITWFNYGIIVK